MGGARQFEADQKRDECDQHRNARPQQVEEIERGNLARRIGRDERPDDACGRTRGDQPKDGGEFPVNARRRTVAALVGNLEGTAERLHDGAQQCRGHGETGDGVGCFHEQGQGPCARYPAHVDDLTEQRRHAVTQEGEVIGFESGQAAEPVNCRRDKQQHHERFAEPVQHAVKVMPALGETEAAAAKRPVAQQRDL